MKTKYLKSGSLSPRVSKKFDEKTELVTYNIKGHAPIIRYTNLDKKTIENSLKDGKKIFLLDIPDTSSTNQDDAHTICVVRVNKNLYFIDPSNSSFSTGYINDIQKNVLKSNTYKLENIKHNSDIKKAQFYKVEKGEKRDCIDIAIKIAQRIQSIRLDENNDSQHVNLIKGCIKPLSNLKAVNTSIGSFNKTSHFSLQSSDLKLSKSTLDYFVGLDSLKKIHDINIKLKPSSPSFKFTKFTKDLNEKINTLAQKQQELKEVESNYLKALANYDMEKLGIKGIKYDNNGWQPIHKIVYEGKFDEFKESFSKNNDIISFLTSDGSNVLHIACVYGKVEFIKFIESSDKEKYKKCLDQYNNEGRLPIHEAYYGGEIEVIKYLDKNNSGESKKLTKDGQTVMHIAAMYDHVELMKIVLQKDKNALMSKDKEGWTPLLSALYAGSSNSFKYLLEQHEAKKINLTFSIENLIDFANDYNNNDLLGDNQDLLDELYTESS